MAREEVPRRRTQRGLIGDVERISGEGARKRGMDRPPRDQAESVLRRRVMPRQGFADPGGSTRDDDLYLLFLTISTSAETASSMPSREPPCSALTV